MLSRFGQEVLLRGYTTRAFDFVEADDPADGMVLVLNEDECSLDPEWPDNYQANITLHEDERIHIPGQMYYGISASILYGD